MDQEQVSVVVGEPMKRKTLKSGIEIWTYAENLSGDAFRETEFPVGWYYNWAKLKFERGTLIGMDVQQVDWKTDL